MRTPPPDELIEWLAITIARMEKERRNQFIEQMHKHKHHHKETVDQIVERARVAWKRMREEAKANESEKT